MRKYKSVGTNQMGPSHAILHEESSYRLYLTNSKTESFLAHSCGVRGNGSDDWWVCSAQGCPTCKVDISPEMLALYQLHNWERLQGTVRFYGRVYSGNDPVMS